MERIRPLGRADIRAKVAGPLSVAVIADALGLHGVDAGTVLGWYASIVAAVSAITARGAADDASRVAIDELAGAIRRSIRDNRAPLLIAAGEALSESEIVSNAAVMMFGGIETTEAMISNAVTHLLRDDAAVAAVRADPSLTAAAVEESLRLEPAAAVVDRYATRNVDLGGASIPRGDLVRVSIAGANRDPAVFPNPDSYDLRRPEVNSQLAFARGPHVCIAMDLARLETRVSVRTLLDRLPGLRLEQPSEAVGLVFRKPASVHVIWR